MTALRVAYVLGTTAGGTGRHVAMLADGCLRAGLGVSAFGPQETRRLFSSGSGVTFEPVQIASRPRSGRDAAAVLRLRRLLARAAPDVVHAHGLRAGAAAALALAPDRVHAPALVVTVHNAAPAALMSGAVYGVLERVVARRAAVVLCVSGDLACRMHRLGARDTAPAVVPAPPAAAPSAEAIARARADIGADGRPIVLAVGRLTGQKGFGTLLDAATRWQDRAPLPLLAIAGDGPLAAELARSAAAAGLAVRFLGQRGDVPALLAAADVLAVPSRWEGQPLIVQEALQAGTPIVASRVGGIPGLTAGIPGLTAGIPGLTAGIPDLTAGIPDLTAGIPDLTSGIPGLTSGAAALLVPPGEPALLAAAVLRVLDDEDLACRLGAAALARAAELPSVADAVRAGLAVYSQLAARRRMS